MGRKVSEKSMFPSRFYDCVVLLLNFLTVFCYRVTYLQLIKFVTSVEKELVKQEKRFQPFTRRGWCFTTPHHATPFCSNSL